MHIKTSCSEFFGFSFFGFKRLWGMLSQDKLYNDSVSSNSQNQSEPAAPQWQKHNYVRSIENNSVSEQ